MFYEYEKIDYENNLPFRIFFVSIARRNYHWHKAPEILWCVKGSVTLTIKDQSYRLKENSMAIINSNEIHELKHDENDDNILIALQPKFDYLKMYFKEIDNIVFENNMLGDIMENNTVRSMLKHIVEMIQNLDNYKTIKDSSTIFKVLGSYNSLLYNLFELKYKVINNEEKENNYSALERLNRILKYVNQNYMDKISIVGISDKEHMNKYYLSHFVKNILGMSLQEYINKVRLEKAIELLISTEDKVIDISIISGFSDVKYLNNLLKKEYGCTATEYRRLYSKKRFGKIEITNNVEHRPINYKVCLDLIEDISVKISK